MTQIGTVSKVVFAWRPQIMHCAHGVIAASCDSPSPISARRCLHQAACPSVFHIRCYPAPYHPYRQEIQTLQRFIQFPRQRPTLHRRVRILLDPLPTSSSDIDEQQQRWLAAWDSEKRPCAHLANARCTHPPARRHVVETVRHVAYKPPSEP